jgi:RNA polymerase sigma-70 factor, ECF subfamily
MNLPRSRYCPPSSRLITVHLLLSPIVGASLPWDECGHNFLTVNSTDQFEAIVSEHYESLYRFALSLTRAEPDACDLTQHTFYVWAKKGHQVRDPAKTKTWLFTTLYRAFLASKRRQYRFPHCELEDEVAVNLQADTPEPSAQADVFQVLPALARVDKAYQAAVALYYLEDCSYKEIAAILEVPTGTVKSRIARGIAQLRVILDCKLSRRERVEWDSSPALKAELIA